MKYFTPPIDRKKIRFSLSRKSLLAEVNENFKLKEGKRLDYSDHTVDMYNALAWYPKIRVIKIGSFGLSCEMKRADFLKHFNFTEEQLETAQTSGFSSVIDTGEHARKVLDWLEIYPPVTFY